MRKHAVGIVVQNRWDLTQKTLESLYHTDQLKDSYDLFIIDNGSDDIVSANLKEWSQSAIVPVKNLVKTNRVGIAPAWNLFLAMTANYPFRTKLDNDLIFANTPVSSNEPLERTKPFRGATPGDAGTNPGAIPTASFVVGAGKRVQARNRDENHTCFLEHVENAISQSGLGICALPPVSVGQTLASAMPALGRVQWRGMPVLMGGCMTITQKAFETLGFLEDRLPCHVDWEYSQRAMAHGINVGYTPRYCVIHMGESAPTLAPDAKQKNEMQSKMMENQLDLKRGFVHTKWEAVAGKIAQAASQNMIINLT